MMQQVQLTEQEWQAVIACMSYAPGRECIPLMNKMGEQLRVMQETQQGRSGPTIQPVTKPRDTMDNLGKMNG